VLATQILVLELNGALGARVRRGLPVLAVTAVLALLLLRRLEGKRRYTVGGKGRGDAEGCSLSSDWCDAACRPSR
jgi:hypothetical protein